MKEKALELKKKILPMKEAIEELSIKERQELDSLEAEYSNQYDSLSEDDKKWVDSEFGVWYGKFLEVETKIFIKPCEG